jgi:hypothetical protein
MLKPQPFGYPIGDSRPVGATAYRAGYFALIGAYELPVPLPQPVLATGKRHRECKDIGLHVLSPRHTPKPTLEGHLTFALKYEGANPAVLSELFAVIEPSEIEAMVRAKPTSAYMRRIWFLYEWLTGRPLDLPDQRRGSYVTALDSALQPVGPPRNSPRHRVRNNLPATLNWFPGPGLL